LFNSLESKVREMVRVFKSKCGKQKRVKEVTQNFSSLLLLLGCVLQEYCGNNSSKFYEICGNVHNELVNNVNSKKYNLTLSDDEEIDSDVENSDSDGNDMDVDDDIGYFNHVKSESCKLKGFINLCYNCNKLFVEVKKCGRCKKVQYCSVVCQRNNWSTHKVNCNN